MVVSTVRGPRSGSRPAARHVGRLPRKLTVSLPFPAAAARGIDLNASYPDCEYKSTALMQVAAEGRLDVVMALINELQVDRLRRDARGATCLHYAAQSGRAKVVKWLIGDGEMEIGGVDAEGQTAMHYAASGAHSSVMDALRSMSSKIVNTKDNRGVTPLMRLVEASDDPRLLDRFVKYGAVVNASRRARGDGVDVCCAEGPRKSLFAAHGGA